MYISHRIVGLYVLLHYVVLGSCGAHNWLLGIFLLMFQIYNLLAVISHNSKQLGNIIRLLLDILGFLEIPLSKLSDQKNSTTKCISRHKWGKHENHTKKSPSHFWTSVSIKSAPLREFFFTLFTFYVVSLCGFQIEKNA